MFSDLFRVIFSLGKNCFQFVLSCSGMTLANTVWKPNSHTAIDESRFKHGKHANNPCDAVTIHSKEREQRSGQHVDPGLLVEKLF